MPKVQQPDGSLVEVAEDALSRSPIPRTTDDVDAEANRRLDKGFPYAGKVISTDDRSQLRIAVASLNASIAVQSGVQMGNYRWANSERDFTWVTSDNSQITLDAFDMINMGQMAAAFVDQIVKAGRVLKDRIIAGETITDVKADALWVL